MGKLKQAAVTGGGFFKMIAVKAKDALKGKRAAKTSTEGGVNARGNEVLEVEGSQGSESEALRCILIGHAR